MNKRAPILGRGIRTWPYLFYAPFFIGFLVFTLFPMLYSFYISLFKWNGIDEAVFVGLKNYAKLLQDKVFWKSIGNTVVVMLITVPAGIILGTICAAMLTSLSKRLAHVFRVLLYLPSVTTAVATGIIFATLFSRSEGGPINAILLSLHLIDEPIYWLGFNWSVKTVWCIMSFWSGLGYSTLMYSAGIAGIDTQLYEAAGLDGAGPVKKFLYITLPELKPIIIFTLITSISNGIQSYDGIKNLMYYEGSAVAGGPGRHALTTMWYMQNVAFGQGNYGKGSAIAYMMFIIIGFTVIARHVTRDRDG